MESSYFQPNTVQAAMRWYWVITVSLVCLVAWATCHGTARVIGPAAPTTVNWKDIIKMIVDVLIIIQNRNRAIFWQEDKAIYCNLLYNYNVIIDSLHWPNITFWMFSLSTKTNDLAMFWFNQENTIRVKYIKLAHFYKMVSNIREFAFSAQHSPSRHTMVLGHCSFSVLSCGLSHMSRNS